MGIWVGYTWLYSLLCMRIGYVLKILYNMKQTLIKMFASAILLFGIMALIVAVFSGN